MQATRLAQTMVSKWGFSSSNSVAYKDLDLNQLFGSARKIEISQAQLVQLEDEVDRLLRVRENTAPLLVRPVRLLIAALPSASFFAHRKRSRRPPAFSRLTAPSWSAL